jgi:hypothetical protein
MGGENLPIVIKLQLSGSKIYANWITSVYNQCKTDSEKIYKSIGDSYDKQYKMCENIKSVI